MKKLVFALMLLSTTAYAWDVRVSDYVAGDITSTSISVGTVKVRVWATAPQTTRGGACQADNGAATNGTTYPIFLGNTWITSSATSKAYILRPGSWISVTGLDLRNLYAVSATAAQTLKCTVYK